MDSVFNHWVLEIHHNCYEPSTAACDAGYFLLGIVFLVVGWVLVRTASRRSTSRAAGG